MTDEQKPKLTRKTADKPKNEAPEVSNTNVVTEVATILDWKEIGKRIESEFELKEGTFTALTYAKLMRIVIKVVKIAVDQMVSDYLEKKKK